MSGVINLHNPTRTAVRTLKDEYSIDEVRYEIKKDSSGKLSAYDTIEKKNMSIETIEAIAIKGDMDAQCAMGDFYSSEGIYFQASKSMAWYTKSAILGHPKAQAYLANAYFNGFGVKKDTKKAVYWAKKSSEMNSASGLFVLGLWHLNEDSYIDAMTLLEKAARLGHPDAMEYLEIASLQSGEMSQKEKIRIIQDAYMPDNSLNSLDETIVNAFTLMKKRHLEAFASPQMFKGLINDLLKNNDDYKGVIRWLDVALSDYDAYALLADEVSRGGNLAKGRLLANLIKEGAAEKLAKEIVGYWALAAGSDVQSITNWLSNGFDEEPEIGSIISFGKYDWRILAVNDSNFLIISKEIVAAMPYHDDYIPVTWEECSLRQYLNSKFFDSFPDKEKLRVVESEVLNKKNPRQGTPGGNNTVDKVFLLSIDEAYDLFNGDADRQVRSQISSLSSAYWWLRSPGGMLDSAAVVKNGVINTMGRSVYMDGSDYGVRPALWIRGA